MAFNVAVNPVAYNMNTDDGIKVVDSPVQSARQSLSNDIEGFALSKFNNLPRLLSNESLLTGRELVLNSIVNIKNVEASLLEALSLSKPSTKQIGQVSASSIIDQLGDAAGVYEDLIEKIYGTIVAGSELIEVAMDIYLDQMKQVLLAILTTDFPWDSKMVEKAAKSLVVEMMLCAVIIQQLATNAENMPTELYEAMLFILNTSGSTNQGVSDNGYGTEEYYQAVELVASYLKEVYPPEESELFEFIWSSFENVVHVGLLGGNLSDFFLENDIEFLSDLHGPLENLYLLIIAQSHGVQITPEALSDIMTMNKSELFQYALENGHGAVELDKILENYGLIVTNDEGDRVQVITNMGWQVLVNAFEKIETELSPEQLAEVTSLLDYYERLLMALKEAQDRLQETLNAIVSNFN